MIKIEAISHLNLSDIKLLKEAGQKFVYKAVSDKYGDVVLKIIKPNQDLERIVREIEILKNLKDINTSHVLEDGKITSDDSEYLYIIESFIEGQELREYMNSKGRLSFLEVCKFLQKMIDTIVILEQNNLVHRDIKPENIMRTEDGEFILIDFGIARDLSRTSLTATDASQGPATIIYAPIEQIDNEKDNIDSRVDLYSVCLVAYEMLNGTNPFAEGCDNILQALRKIDQGKFKAIDNDAKYNELIEFIHTNMNRYRTRRSPSAEDAKKWIDDIVYKLFEEQG
jgi:serine/threonine-protein kinase